jgi:lipopolysaccharide export system ATP-binding protein
MGYLPQDHSIFRKLTVEQNILAILEVLPMARSLGRALSRSERWDRTDAVLEQFGLTHIRKNNAWRISGGEKRRLEIARCLVCEPLLILLDEPFTGIDPKTIADIQQIVLQLRNQGIGMLLTDHNVREALKITDRSYLIKDGKVRTHGTPRQILHDPIAINEYLGHGFHDDILTRPTTKNPEAAIREVKAPAEVAEPEPVRIKQPDPNSTRIKAAEPTRAKPQPGKKGGAPAELIVALIEELKGRNGQDAADHLLRLGDAAIPALLQTLERRDVELRRQAHEILQILCKTAVAFDPYAPEAMRRQQLASLRERWERKAG